MFSKQSPLWAQDDARTELLPDAGLVADMSPGGSDDALDVAVEAIAVVDVATVPTSTGVVTTTICGSVDEDDEDGGDDEDDDDDEAAALLSIVEIGRTTSSLHSMLLDRK